MNSRTLRWISGAWISSTDTAYMDPQLGRFGVFFSYPLPSYSTRNPPYPFQNGTTKISTGLAENFHFSLALEWVANVEWA